MDAHHIPVILNSEEDWKIIKADLLALITLT